VSWPVLPDERATGPARESDAAGGLEWPALPDELDAVAERDTAPAETRADAARLLFLQAEQRGEPWNA
jgi:hypothetical protein